MKLLIDVDGVLRDMISSIVDIYNRKHDTDFNQFDMDDWDLEKLLPKINDLWKDMFIPHQEEIFLEAKPFNGAVDHMKELYDKHDIHIVTHQARDFEHYTLEWLANNKIKYNSISFTKDKGSVIGDVSLDDNIHYCKKFKKSTQIQVCMVRPYSIGYNGVRVYNMCDFNSLIERYDEVYNFDK